MKMINTATGEIRDSSQLSEEDLDASYFDDFTECELLEWEEYVSEDIEGICFCRGHSSQGDKCSHCSERRGACQP